MKQRERGQLGLQARLLALLLAFGAIPLGLAMIAGYTVSRATIVQQAEEALEDLIGRQAGYVAAEVRRQRLLLRTITGQVTSQVSRGAPPQARLADFLASSLLDEGVFDGLRLVDERGQLLVNVALRETTPHWPTKAPAVDWETEQIGIHRDDRGIIAYLLAVSVQAGGRRWWLEGHVRAEDFRRLFDIPLHLMGGVELGLFDPEGHPIVVPHAHAEPALRAVFGSQEDDRVQHAAATVDSLDAIVFATEVPGTDWRIAGSLPLEIALAPLATVRNVGVAGYGILLLVIVLAANGAARSVTTPVRLLAAAARDFGRSGAHAPVPTARVPEIDALVASFSRMVGDLRQSRSEIQRLHEQEMERVQQLATVGELASGIAHEIRNPLTGVVGALELAGRNLPEHDPAGPLLNEAREQLKRIEVTTTQLLQYARPPDLRVIRVDPDLLVDRAVRIVQPKATAANVSIVSDSRTPATDVEVDPELLVQVIVNLMLNAVDAMKGSGELTIRVTHDTTHVRIAVADTGPGVSPELRGDIFRPFFTSKHQGTGLGLSISRQIVERHGGSLVLEEAVRGGATFVILLPQAGEEGPSRE